MLDLEGENTISEESRGGAEETNSESVEKNSNLWGLSSLLTQRELAVLRRGYGLSKEVGARLARENETARSLAKGYIAIFES